jgi:hypothetical protein
MKKKIVLAKMIATAFILGFIFTACDQLFENCIQGNGVEKSEIRPVSSFETVRLYDDFEVYLVQDSIREVKIIAEENIIPYILTRINNNILLIKSKDNRCLNHNKPIKIYIKAPDIKNLQIVGSGNIQTEDTLKSSKIYLSIEGSGNLNAIVKAENIIANIAGSGNINLFGNTPISDLNISGSGKIQSVNMVQNKCYINISGSGGIYVNVRQLLDVTITGSGTVYYTGGPVVMQNITGSGSIIKL